MFPEITNYTLVREIGAGGMAVVYEAIDVRLQRTVAVKVLHPHRCREPAATDRFMREARAAAKIDHPNVVRIFDYAATGELHYIVMEYVPGTTVERVLKEREFIPVDTAIAIMSQIAEALAQAHALGIIHRDVKPANILLHTQGRAMLSDFGLAHHLPDHRLTTDNAVAGTPLFMSPEQITGRSLLPATDIYSWAICFCAMVAGKLPYCSQEFPDVVAGIRKGAVQFEDVRARGLPGRYHDVLHRCCAADPRKRIPDAKELLRQLALAGKPEPGKIDVSLFIAPADKKTADESPHPLSATVVIPKKKLRAGRSVVAAVSVALVAGVLIVNQRMDGDKSVAGVRAEPEIRPSERGASVVSPPIAAAQPVSLPPTQPETRKSAAATAAAPLPQTTGRRPITIDDTLSGLSGAGGASPAGAVGRAVVRSSALQTPDSGALFVHCNPWAIVSINGREIGSTPFEKPVPLQAGAYAVTLTNGFCEPLTDTVTIVAGVTQRRKYTLKVRSP